MVERIAVEDLTVRFRFYTERNTTLAARAVELGRRVLGQHRPREFKALSDISFSADDGDIIGIIGPNGAGKTTLLRTICGIYSPDAGSVRTQGRISMLLSLGTGFDNNLSGIENIRLNGLLMGMSAPEIEARIPEIADFAGLGDYLHSPLHYYSTGMISRLSFSIVVAIQPEILVIDEVFSVGDLAFQKKSERAMHELMTKAVCQVIVSHNLDFILGHCNKALYLKGGRLKAIGDPDAIVARYRRDSG